MTELLKEQLSAFIDGELPRGEGELLVRQVPRDGELRAAASRYYLIGEAIRAERSPVRKSFAERVSAAVATTTPDDSIAASVTTMARELPRSRFAGWWKPVAGIAVAASVAMVAIFVMRGQQDQGGASQIASIGDGKSPGISEPGPQPTPKLTPAKTACSEAASYTVPNKDCSADLGLARAQLASYVFAHSEYSTLPGRRNVVNDAAIEDAAAVPAPAPVSKR